MPMKVTDKITETEFEYKFEDTSLNSLISFSFTYHTSTKSLLTNLLQCKVIFGSSY